MRGVGFVSAERPRGSRRRRRGVDHRVLVGAEEGGGGRGGGVRRVGGSHRGSGREDADGPGAAATPVDEADVGRSAGVHATGDGTVGSMDGRGDPLQGCVHAQPARD